MRQFLASAVIPLTVVGVAFVFANAFASAAPVVALGASNTEGHSVSRSDAFPAQLENMLAARGCRVAVANEGISGDTTSGMRNRLASVIGADTKVLILQPGGNDARKGATSEERDENIAAIREYAQQHGVKTIMLAKPGKIAGAYRDADGQHFTVEGHQRLAAYLLPQVISTGVCKSVQH